MKCSIGRGLLAHSYIFFGPKGTGKFTTALELAKAINCSARTLDACDGCATCRKIEGKNHMDLTIVSPDEKGSGEVKIDMVRGLQHLVNLKPYEMRKKVCIIDGADKMSPEAANALLKTLEEPPRDSILILIVENLAKLPGTVISRCQQVRFYPLPASELEEILIKRDGLDSPRARCIAQFASGRLGDAIRFVREDGLGEKNRVIDKLLNGLLFDEERNTISKEDAQGALDVILSWCRDMVMARLGMDRTTFINIDRAEQIQNEASNPALRLEGLTEVIGEILNCRSHLERNANFRLAWTVLGERVAGRLRCTR